MNGARLYYYSSSSINILDYSYTTLLLYCTIDIILLQYSTTTIVRVAVTGLETWPGATFLRGQQGPSKPPFTPCIVIM